MGRLGSDWVRWRGHGTGVVDDCSVCRPLVRRNWFRRFERFEFRAGFQFHIGMQAVAVRVHGYDCHEIMHVKLPHGLRDTEVKQTYAQYLINSTRIILGSTADA